MEANISTASPPPGTSTWFCIRSHTAEDQPAVYESWLGTFKISRAAGCIPNNLFDQVYSVAIDQLIERGMKVDIICPANRPSQMLGYVAYEPDPKATGKSVVHYLFVKAPFRRRGLATTLLAHVGNADGRFVYTYQTSFSKYFPAAFHNPGLARRKAL